MSPEITRNEENELVHLCQKWPHKGDSDDAEWQRAWLAADSRYRLWLEGRLNSFKFQIDWQTREAIASEAFFVGVATFKPSKGKSLKGWLEFVARRMAFSELKKKRLAPMEIDPEDGKAKQAQQKQEDQLDLESAMTDLSEEDRELLKERLKGETLEKIAELQGCSKSKVARDLATFAWQLSKTLKDPL